MSDASSPSLEAVDGLTMTLLASFLFFPTTGLFDSSADESFRSKSLKSDSSKCSEDFLCLVGLFHKGSQLSDFSELLENDPFNSIELSHLSPLHEAL